MMQFLQENAGTIIVGAVVLAVLAAIIISMIRKKKQGKSIVCNCSCDGCGSSGACSGAADKA